MDNFTELIELYNHLKNFLKEQGFIGGVVITASVNHLYNTHRDKNVLRRNIQLKSAEEIANPLKAIYELSDQILKYNIDRLTMFIELYNKVLEEQKIVNEYGEVIVRQKITFQEIDNRIIDSKDEIEAIFKRLLSSLREVRSIISARHPVFCDSEEIYAKVDSAYEIINAQMVLIVNGDLFQIREGIRERKHVSNDLTSNLQSDFTLIQDYVGSVKEDLSGFHSKIQNEVYSGLFK